MYHIKDTYKNRVGRIRKAFDEHVGLSAAGK